MPWVEWQRINNYKLNNSTDIFDLLNIPQSRFFFFLCRLRRMSWIIPRPSTAHTVRPLTTVILLVHRCRCCCCFWGDWNCLEESAKEGAEGNGGGADERIQNLNLTWITRPHNNTQSLWISTQCQYTFCHPMPCQSLSLAASSATLLWRTE